MNKILKRIKSVFLMARYQPKTFLSILLYPAILIVGGLISIAPMIIGYKNWYEVEAIQMIMSWVTVILSVLFGFAYIKYIQENLLGRKISIFRVKSLMAGKWFDGIVMSIKYAIIIVAPKLFMQSEIHTVIRSYKFDGTIRYEHLALWLVTTGLVLLLTNRLGLHRQMAILKKGEGNYSLREAFRSTKHHWKDLLPISIIETLAIAWTGIQNALIIYYDFKIDNIVLVMIMYSIASILWMYFEIVYKVSCYTEYQAMQKEL